MKHILFLLLFCTAGLSAQRISGIQYGTVVPTRTPSQSAKNPEFYYNTTTGLLYRWDRTTKLWGQFPAPDKYAEVGISNDTTTLSFAATVPLAYHDLTLSAASGFTMTGDSMVTYIGTKVTKFVLSYGVSFSFAEAANIINTYVVQNSSSILRSRTRQTITTLTAERETVGKRVIITVSPGDTFKLFSVPSAHTGTDVLTIYEAALTLTELK